MIGVGARAITTDSHPEQQVISKSHSSQTIANLQLSVARSIKLNSTNVAQFCRRNIVLNSS